MWTLHIRAFVCKQRAYTCVHQVSMNMLRILERNKTQTNYRSPFDYNSITVKRNMLVNMTVCMAFVEYNDDHDYTMITPHYCTTDLYIYITTKPKKKNICVIKQ